MLGATLSPYLIRSWQRVDLLTLLLSPLSGVYRGYVAARRLAYRIGMLPTTRFDVPILVVGNVTVGGTGKTPVVLWLAQVLKAEGFVPGIVSRGYGVSVGKSPCSVLADSDPARVGDEPVLLARRSGCPVVVHPRRIHAVRTLIDQYDCNVVIADDGLQHYALARDVEIGVIDHERQFGNGLCLPAGPLREPVSRLEACDFLVCNGGTREASFTMHLCVNAMLSVRDFTTETTLAAFRGHRVHGVAGIGNPERFFRALKGHGLEVIEHSFPDHHAFVPDDLVFPEAAPIIMTEKDAIKCQPFAESNMWFARVEAEISERMRAQLLVTLLPKQR